MAQTQDNLDAATDDAPDEAPEREPAATDELADESFSSIWQLPVLLLGIGLFVLGVWAAMPQEEADDFPGALESVRQRLEAREFDEADERLRALEPHIERAEQPMQAWFEQLWGDLVYHQQHEAGVDDAINHERIIGYYRQAAYLGRELDDERLQRLAESLVSLGREDEAMDVVDDLSDAPARRRYSVLRTLIERHRDDADVTIEQLHKLVNRYLEEAEQESDKAARRAALIWGHEVKAGMLLDAGDARTVLDSLVRTSLRLIDEGGDKDLAGFDLLLAAAHQKVGDFDKARAAYDTALAKLDAADERRAVALVGLGQIKLIQDDDTQAAWQYFKEAEERYRPQRGDPANAPYLDALIGRIDCEARLGRHDEAVAHVDEAVAVLNASPRPPAEKRDRLINTVLSHHVAATDVEEHRTALAYLESLPPLYDENATPPEWLALFALTHERIAERMLLDAGLPAPQEAALGGGDAAAGGDTGANQPVAITLPPRQDEAARLTRQEAARHYEKAAGYHNRYANEMMGQDPQTAGDSLWRAAEAYDKAYLWQHAIRMYNQFVNERGNDPKRVEAIYRLGLAHMAAGEHKVAINKFEELRDRFANHRVTSAALVPLARSLDATDQQGEAIKVLLDVVTDHPAITPQSGEYREALILLGRLYHDKQQYEDAIKYLAMAVQRYGDSRPGITLRFKLAEAYRQSVAAIDKTLEEPLPQSKRSEYQQERTRRLEQSLVLHSQVVTQLHELHSENAEALTPIELLYYRNASFYRADCAFDLKRYEQAIELYDWAGKEWSNHPAALIADIQRVNAYASLGREQEARAANRQARERLRRIPDEKFDDPSLPMKREHWENWLRWANEMQLFESGSVAGVGASDNGGGSLP